MIRRKCVDRGWTAGSHPTLSDRQYDVLIALADDAPRRDIAMELGISLARLDEHIALLKRLAHAKTRVGIVLWGVQQHLLELDDRDGVS